MYDINQLPRTSQDAVREFNERYIAGVAGGPVPTWASTYGDVIDTQTPMTTFPFSLMTARYQKSTGENRAKSMGEESFDLKTEEYDDGYEAPLLGVLGLTTNTFAYRKWQEAPRRLQLAESKFVAQRIAELLHSGTTTVSGYDKVAFFHASAHKANPHKPEAGNWGNYQATPKSCTSITDILAEMALMRGSVLDENGELLDVNPSVIKVPAIKYDACNAEVSKAFLANGESNPLHGKLTVEKNAHLDPLDANDWYLIDPDLKVQQGLSPWVATRFVIPATLGLRIYDEMSDFFKDTGKLKISSHIHYGFGLGFPHGIRRVAGN